MDATAVTTGDGTAAVESEQDGTTEEVAPIPKDDLFHLLQNQRRRRVLSYLRDADDQVDMRDVAEHIAALENDVEVTALSSAQRKRVYVGLYQCHLPKLDEAGVIHYDQSRGTVERTGITDQLFPYLEVPGETESPVEDVRQLVLRYHGVATVLGVVLTAAAWASVLPVAGLWLATVVTVLFAAATFAVVYR
ncbi:DUF7344 domain-containing protein [Halomarina ordinaria]|uniref:DUF7344 domain-containing protein n=1 Tax=Halomarina ordinaria TaxID=3033939 RepID=A0ABD5UGH8_9EURY|nr:hypothetical protein [Halomarina sp. PSRA2]